jgi:hypothetical protein
MLFSLFARNQAFFRILFSQTLSKLRYSNKKNRSIRPAADDQGNNHHIVSM